MSMITDRLPTADDGDDDGDVYMKRRPGSPDSETTMVHWSHVKQGVPWRHTFCWKPKRKLPGVNGQWIRASAMKPVAADAESDGEVQVRPDNPCTIPIAWRRWYTVEGDVFWRPSALKDVRPLEAAQ